MSTRARSLKSVWRARRAQAETLIGTIDYRGRSVQVMMPTTDLDQWLALRTDDRIISDPAMGKQFTDLVGRLYEHAAIKIEPNANVRESGNSSLYPDIERALDYFGYARDESRAKMAEPGSEDKLKQAAFSIFEQQGADRLSAKQVADLLMNMAVVLHTDMGMTMDEAKAKLSSLIIEWGGGGPENLHLNSLNMRWRSRRAVGADVVLYHGTLKKFVPQIMSEGLTPSAGWGGAATEGVYLSGSIEGALYWAKLAHQRSVDEKMEAERFDRQHGKNPGAIITVLQITIPANQVADLRADMEQAEDVGFEGSEEDWSASLEQIGDVRYNGAIPPGWIKPLDERRAASKTITLGTKKFPRSFKRGNKESVEFTATFVLAEVEEYLKALAAADYNYEDEDVLEKFIEVRQGAEWDALERSDPPAAKLMSQGKGHPDYWEALQDWFSGTLSDYIAFRLSKEGDESGGADRGVIDTAEIIKDVDKATPASARDEIIDLFNAGKIDKKEMERRLKKMAAAAFVRRAVGADPAPGPFKSPWPDQIQAFMQAAYDQTVGHPFTRGQRIWNDQVIFEVSPWSGGPDPEYPWIITLKWIQAMEPGKGHARACLSWLTALADEYGVFLELEAKPTGQPKIPRSKLINLYKDVGFESTDRKFPQDMRRNPLQAAWSARRAGEHDHHLGKVKDAILELLSPGPRTMARVQDILTSRGVDSYVAHKAITELIKENLIHKDDTSHVHLGPSDSGRAGKCQCRGLYCMHLSADEGEGCDNPQSGGNFCDSCARIIKFKEGYPTQRVEHERCSNCLQYFPSTQMAGGTCRSCRPAIENVPAGPEAPETPADVPGMKPAERQKKIDALLDRWSNEPDARPQIEQQLKSLRALRSRGSVRRADDITLFHGTTKEFDEVDTERGELGSHWGTPDQANAVLDEGGNLDTGNLEPKKRDKHLRDLRHMRVIPADIDVKKPLRLVDRGHFDPHSIADQLISLGIITSEQWDEIYLLKNWKDQNRVLQAAIVNAGYDGVVYLNRREGIGGITDVGEQMQEKMGHDDFQDNSSDEEFQTAYPGARDSYIVFDQGQIKGIFASWRARRGLENFGAGKRQRPGAPGDQDIFQRVTDVPWYDNLLQNPDYFRENKGVVGQIVEMSPDDYLARCAELHGSNSERQEQMVEPGRLAELEALVKGGTRLFMPYLDLKDRSQEGRHRAVLAKKLGVATMPVLIVTEVDEKTGAGERQRPTGSQRQAADNLWALTNTFLDQAYSPVKDKPLTLEEARALAEKLGQHVPHFTKADYLEGVWLWARRQARAGLMPEPDWTWAGGGRPMPKTESSTEPQPMHVGSLVKLETGQTVRIKGIVKDMGGRPEMFVAEYVGGDRDGQTVALGPDFKLLGTFLGALRDRFRQRRAEHSDRHSWVVNKCTGCGQDYSYSVADTPCPVGYEACGHCGDRLVMADEEGVCRECAGQHGASLSDRWRARRAAKDEQKLLRELTCTVIGSDSGTTNEAVLPAGTVVGAQPWSNDHTIFFYSPIYSRIIVRGKVMKSNQYSAPVQDFRAATDIGYGEGTGYEHGPECFCDECMAKDDLSTHRCPTCGSRECPGDGHSIDCRKPGTMTLKDVPTETKDSLLDKFNRGEIDEETLRRRMKQISQSLVSRWRERRANDPLKKIIEVNGVKVGIEWPKGSTRTWSHIPGNDYSRLMKVDYGYIRQTEGEDGEEIDVYSGPDRDSDLAFVVTQLDRKTGEYDEDKIMLGYSSKAEAEKSYIDHMDDESFGGIKELSWDKFLAMVPKSQRAVEKVAAAHDPAYAAAVKALCQALTGKPWSGAEAFPSIEEFMLNRGVIYYDGGYTRVMLDDEAMESGKATLRLLEAASRSAPRWESSLPERQALEALCEDRYKNMGGERQSLLSAWRRRAVGSKLIRTMKDAQTIKKMQEAGWTFDIRGERVLLGEPGQKPLSMTVDEARAAMQKFMSTPSAPASDDYARGYQFGKEYTKGWSFSDKFNLDPMEDGLGMIGDSLLKCKKGDEGAELHDAEGNGGKIVKMWLRKNPAGPAYEAAQDKAAFERGWSDGWNSGASLRERWTRRAGSKLDLLWRRWTRDGDSASKNAWHKEATRVLKALAAELQLPDGSYDLRSNKAGSAVMGEVTLHSDDIYVQVSGSGLGPGREVMYRIVSGRGDYTGMANQWMSYDDVERPSAAAAKINALLSKKGGDRPKPSGAKGALTFETERGARYEVNVKGEIIRLDMKDFEPSGQWKLVGIRNPDSGQVIRFEDFARGLPKDVFEWEIIDFDHGSQRIWGEKLKSISISGNPPWEQRPKQAPAPKPRPKPSVGDTTRMIENAIIDLLRKGPSTISKDLHEILEGGTVSVGDGGAVDSWDAPFADMVSDVIGRMIDRGMIVFDGSTAEFSLLKEPEPTTPEHLPEMSNTDRASKIDDLLDQLGAETDPAKKKQIEQRIRSLQASILTRVKVANVEWIE